MAYCRDQAFVATHQRLSMSGSMHPRSRTRLSLAQKAQMLDMMGNRASIDDMMRAYNCARRTVLKIRAQRDEIRAALHNAAQKSTFKASRPPQYPEIERHLYDFVQAARACKLPITSATLRAQALNICESLKQGQISEEAAAKLDNFKASQAWCLAFTRRFAMRTVSLHGEAGSVTIQRVASAIGELREKLAEFAPDCVYNMDETGLFFKLFPKKTCLMCSEDRRKVRGTKEMRAKAGVSLYIFANATGTQKVPVGIIGKPANPRCLRKGQPKIPYFSQSNAWSDTRTFRKWFHTVFLPFIRRKTSQKVALIMDNCGPHDTDLLDTRRQVTVLTLPPNCTSVFQPMDMGVIASVKARYKSLLLQRVSTMLQERAVLRAAAAGMTPGTRGLDEGYDPHLLDVSELVSEAWESVSARTIARCWVKADILPRAVQSDIILEHGKSLDVKKRDCYRQQVSEIASLLSKLKLETIEKEDGGVTNMQCSLEEEDIDRWINIEEDEKVRQAVLEGEMEEQLNAFIPSQEGVRSDEDGSDAERAAQSASTSRGFPMIEEIAERLREAELLVQECGVEEASRNLRSVKRALLRAAIERNAQKRRQSLMTEFFH